MGYLKVFIYRVFKTKKSYNTSFFPNDIKYDWNEDNFGPIIVPQIGMTVDLNQKNLSIEEGAKLKIKAETY